MARMYPQPMHPDTRSHAERKLYAAFQNQLPDDYVVFHSVCWQVRDTTGGCRCSAFYTIPIRASSTSFSMTTRTSTAQRRVSHWNSRLSL